MKSYLKFHLSIATTIIFWFSSQANAIDPVRICGPVHAQIQGKKLEFSSLKQLKSYFGSNKSDRLTIELPFYLSDIQCAEMPEPGIYLGRIYDSDVTTLNGNYIGSTGSTETKTFQTSIIERAYGIPRSLLKCNGQNVLRLDIKRLIPGRTGPLEDCFEINRIDEVTSKAEFSEFIKVDSFKYFAFVFLALVPLFMTLFLGDPEGKIFRKFGAFLFMSGLLSLSLSGFFHTFAADTQVMFRVNATIVSFFLATLFDLVLTNWDLRFTRFNWFFLAGILALINLAPSLQIVDKAYSLLLIVYTLCLFYALISLAPRLLRFSNQTLSKIQWFAFLGVNIGISFDVARYFQIHSLPNISPWFVLLGVLIIGSTFMMEVKQLFEKAKEFEENKRTIEIGLLSSQVAHDIRSPLSALSIVSESLAELPEQKRILVRNSVNRITDIANSLLEKGKFNSSTNLIAGKPGIDLNFRKTEITLVSSLIDSLTSEKRIQFRALNKVNIISDIKDSYGLFVDVNPNVLKRILSNLVNNSVEALSTGLGSVTIKASAEERKVHISVIDDGCGFPESVLKTLGKRGVTFGKSETSSGSGLGIHYAMSTLEEFSGELRVESQLGQGAVVTIVLPRAPQPYWFLDKLVIHHQQKVIICDDDSSIHQIWAERLADIGVRGEDILNFTRGNAFKAWILNNQDSDFLCLVDFELIKQEETGLDLIEELGIQERSVLVTSRYEEIAIKSRCEKLSMKMIPKDIAGLVPIDFVSQLRHYSACLIDDDNLVRLTWQFAAQEAGQSFKAFQSYEAFLEEASEVSKDTPIYIDLNLAGGVRGTDVAQQLAKLGFRNLNLATGFDLAAIPEIPRCINGVIGKEPTFT